MKPSRILATLLAIIICVFAADAVYAKGSKKGKGSKAKPTPVPEKVSAHSTIVSVSNAGISVQAGHATKQFRIDAYTTVTIDGNAARVAALKSGMYAEVTSDGFNPTTARSIAATIPKGH